MHSKILQILHEDDEARKAFANLLAFLMQEIATPFAEGTTLVLDVEARSLQFDSQLTALTDLVRAIDVQENDTKIGHWCTRNNESKVRGMDEWYVYWLEMQSGVDEDGVYLYHEYPVKLTLWAVGKDDNTVQKAIKVWVETHFPEWEISALRCVRR